MELHALPRSQASIHHHPTPFIISPLLALLCPLRMRPRQAMHLYIARDQQRQAGKEGSRPRPLSKSHFETLPSKSPSRARLPFPLSRAGSKILLLKRQRKGEGGCRLFVICTVISSDHPPQKPRLLLKPCQRHQAVAAPSQDPQDMENSTLKERKPPQEHIYISEKFPEQPNLQRQKAD